MLRTTLIRSTFFVALVAWGAAGCSSAAPPSESPTGQSGSPATGAATVPRPFESLLVLSQDNQKALHDAEELAVSECMKAQGFRYTPQAFESAQPADGPGMGDVAAARTRGYGIAEARQRGETAVAENDPDKDPDLGRLTAQERQAFTAALIGPAPTGPNDPSRATIALPGGATVSVNTNGCASKGRAAVYGDDLRWQQLFGTVEDLRAKAYDGLSTDPAYESAVQQWRTCMRGKGFNYEGPDAARDVLGKQINSGGDIDGLRATEIQVATADAECVQSTGMTGVVSPLLAASEKKVADANEGVIVEFQELQQTSVTRAKSLVGSGNG